MPRPNYPPQQNHAPVPSGPVTMMNPTQLRPNISSFVLDYNLKAPILLQAVIPANPNYKTQVGEFIYEFVERETGENLAPKITGMLIDLPIHDIRDYLADFGKIVLRINEARALITTPPQ